MTGELILSALMAFFQKGGRQQVVTKSAKRFFQDSDRAKQFFSPVVTKPRQDAITVPVYKPPSGIITPPQGELRLDPTVKPPTNTKFIFARR